MAKKTQKIIKACGYKNRKELDQDINANYQDDNYRIEYKIANLDKLHLNKYKTVHGLRVKEIK